MKQQTKKEVIFITIFALAGFVALQIPIAQLVGSKVKFTVYDAFAPIAGAFIGTVPGIIAVFLMQFFNFLMHGAHIEDPGTIIRFFPMLFGAYYFARKDFGNLLIPMIAIAIFLAHPIGRQVWYFTLFWTIPIVAYFVRDRFLLARALGATFTAHAVGGATWIWAFSLPATVWHSLIPIVAAERMLFALGIAGSYIVITNLLYALEKWRSIYCLVPLNSHYVLRALRIRYDHTRS